MKKMLATYDGNPVLHSMKLAQQNPYVKVGAESIHQKPAQYRGNNPTQKDNSSTASMSMHCLEDGHAMVNKYHYTILNASQKWLQGN